MDKSPLEQAEARILALEAEVDRLRAKRESNLESAESAIGKVERLMGENAALDKENIVMRRQMGRLIDERDALKARLSGTVYDGTPGALPPEGLHLVSLADECGWLIRQGSRDNWKARIGDTWWPLPGGGE